MRRLSKIDVSTFEDRCVALRRSMCRPSKILRVERVAGAGAVGRRGNAALHNGRGDLRAGIRGGAVLHSEHVASADADQPQMLGMLMVGSPGTGIGHNDVTMCRL